MSIIEVNWKNSLSGENEKDRFDKKISFFKSTVVEGSIWGGKL